MVAPLPISALATHSPAIPAPNPQSLLTPEDKSRFKQWFDYDARLTEVADSCQTNVVDLALWAAQPHITAILDHVRHIASQRSQTLHAEAKHASIARLFAIVRSEPNNEVARRAADRLLRPNISQVLDQDQHPLDDPRPDPHADPAKLPARHNPGRRAYQLVATRSQVVVSSDGPVDPPCALATPSPTPTESSTSLKVQTLATTPAPQGASPLPTPANSPTSEASPAPALAAPDTDPDEDLDLDLNDPPAPQSTIPSPHSEMTTASPRAP